MDLGDQGLEVRDGRGVDVVDAAKVEDDEPNGRQGGRVRDARGPAQAVKALLGDDGPVALLLGPVGAVVHGRVVRLDRVEDALRQAVRVGEVERLVEAEHVHVLEAGVGGAGGGRGQAAFGVEGGGEGGAGGGGRGGDAGERLAEDEVDDVEADGDEDAELGRVEEGQPKGEHGRDEVGERGLPEAVKGRGRVDEGPDGADDDGGEGGLGDPVQGADELVDAYEDDGRRDDAAQRGAHLARRVDRGARHGAADAHGVEEAVEEVAHAKVAQFLALVGHVVVLDAKGPRNGRVLNGGADEDGDGAAGDAADEVARRHHGRLLALGLDLDDGKEVVVGGAGVVDAVADARVQDEGEEGARNGEHPDGAVPVAPALAGVVEEGEEEDAAEADGAGDAAGGGQERKDLADLGVGLGGRGDVGAEEGAHLVEDDGDGHGRDEARDDGDGDELEEEAEPEEAEEHAVDAHHEGHGRGDLLWGVARVAAKGFDNVRREETDERGWSRGEIYSFKKNEVVIRSAFSRTSVSLFFPWVHNGGGDDKLCRAS